LNNDRGQDAMAEHGWGQDAMAEHGWGQDAMAEHGWGRSFNAGNDDEIQETVGGSGFEYRIMIPELSYQLDWWIR